MFSSINCVPNPQALQQVTQFEVQVSYEDSGDLHLTLLTLTELFECVLKAADVNNLVRWANAVACGVDQCTAFLWQRCQIELIALTLRPGWVRLLVRSCRANERCDLVAVLSVHEMVSKFRSSFAKLTTTSNGKTASVKLVEAEEEHRDPWDQLGWPNVAAETHWNRDEIKVKDAPNGK